MSDRCRLNRSAIGAAAALIVGGLAAPSHAGMVENGQKMMRMGSCVYVGGNPKNGRLCIVRDNVGNPKFVHFHLTFDGLVTHFNLQDSRGQSEIQATERRSARMYRRADPGQFVQVKVQACSKKPWPKTSDCTAWAVLKIMM